MEAADLIQLVFVLVIGGAFKYVINQMTKMKDKQTELDNRLGIEETKGGARDKVAAQTLDLLGKISKDLGTMKEEQGYWRGRQEGMK